MKNKLIIENWDEILHPANLKPMNENSPIIDLMKPNDNQMVDELEEITDLDITLMDGLENEPFYIEDEWDNINGDLILS